jgi:hypothetical protein
MIKRSAEHKFIKKYIFLEVSVFIMIGYNILGGCQR